MLLLMSAFWEVSTVYTVLDAGNQKAATECKA